MKKVLVALAMAMASSCGGGQSPELYSVVVDFFRPSTSCYLSGQYPATSVTQSSPMSIRIEVYDWQEQKVFLEITDGAVSIDMGDAPNVTLGGLLEGTRPQSGDQIAFAANRTLETTQPGLGGTTTITDTTSTMVTFGRQPTWKGTMELKSSRTCVGANCGGSTPSCTISNIPVRGTRLQVDYEQAP
jgi:hypothetical protein